MANRTIINGRNGESLNISKNSVHRVRAEMKSDVDTFDSYGLDIFVAIDRGLGEGFTSEIDGKCGKEVEMIVRTEFIVSDRMDSDFNSPFGKLLSQFKILKNPFTGIARNIGKIDSEEFEATNGILDRYYPVRLWGSTFAKGPKIFSDEVMKTVRTFGGSSSVSYQPFYNCENMKEIANQGTFGRIEYLYPTDFTYQNDDGSVNLSAYPSGGSPIGIFRYVYAEGQKVNMSEKFPQFKTDRLKHCVDHFVVDAVLMDKTSTISLPFGGITFQETDMETISMPQLNFEYKEDEITKPDSNFTLSWSSLGVNSPKSCKIVKGLHNIYQHVFDVYSPSNIANPAFISKNLSTQWGNDLKKLDEDKKIKHTDDWMPLVPEGIVSSHGHYRKIFIQEYFEKDKAIFTDYHMVNMMDGKELNYKVQKLPKHDVEDYYITDYCRNLYAYNEVNTDIVIPAIPGPIDKTANCYKRTFYNTVSKKDLKSQSLPKTHAHLVWSKPVGINNPWDMGDLFDKPEHRFIFNIDDTYNGEFRDIFEKHCALSEIDTDKIINKTPDADDKQKDEIRKKINSSTIKRYIYNGRDEKPSSVRFNSFKDMMDSVTGITPPLYYHRPITSKIVLEREAYNMEPENVCGWQEECFFGSSIDPTVVDCFIYINPTNTQQKDYDQNNYKNALNVRKIFQDHEYTITLKGNVIYLGEELMDHIRNDSGSDGYSYNLIIRNVFEIDFSIIVTYSYNETQLNPPVSSFYDLSKVKTDGMAPRNEYISWFPYRDSIPVDTVRGDYESLLENKNIKLNKYKNVLGGMVDYTQNPKYIDWETRDVVCLNFDSVTVENRVNPFYGTHYEYFWMMKDPYFEVDESNREYMFNPKYEVSRPFTFFKDGMNQLPDKKEMYAKSDGDLFDSGGRKILEIEQEVNKEWTR